MKVFDTEGYTKDDFNDATIDVPPRVKKALSKVIFEGCSYSVAGEFSGVSKQRIYYHLKRLQKIRDKEEDASK